MNEGKNVYIVSYIPQSMWLQEPIITVFNNKEEAEKMMECYGNNGAKVWMDEAPIYSSFEKYEEEL